MKKFFKKIVPILIFIVGALIMVYPLISQQFYMIESNNQIVEYINKVNSLENEEINRKLRLARIYNETIDLSKLIDPYTQQEKKDAIAEYARMLEVNEKIGYIEIPKIGQNIPIYAGTNESVLQKGAGHLEGTSLPVGGIDTHTVITAHRGLPTAKLFTELDKLEIGDKFYIHVLGEVYAYQVNQILTVEPTNFDPILIKEKKDYATLLTCTPYMINSHRLLVRGERIDYTAPVDEPRIDPNKIQANYRNYFIIAIVFILVLIILIYLNWKSIKNLTRRIVGNEKK